MKIIILYVSLIYLGTVFCYHTADSENQRGDENLITSAEHSREDRHQYDDFERETRRPFEHHKQTTPYKRIPAIRRPVHREDEHTDDKEYRTNDSEKKLHHEEDAGLDRESRGRLPENESDHHIDYQPEEYPSLPIRPSSTPPIVFFRPQPSSGRRQIRLPVYQRPNYSRLYDVGPLPVSYRTINPVAYSVPSRVRNVVLGYPSLPSPVRYAYSSPNSAFDNGVVPVEYRGFIAEEYDEFLKKK